MDIEAEGLLLWPHWPRSGQASGQSPLVNRVFDCIPELPHASRAIYYLVDLVHIEHCPSVQVALDLGVEFPVGSKLAHTPAPT